ncbi:TPA: hypothetical protein DDW35_00205 [Candidatus Sumerlaeota bacterium]|jgi:hypothetical protein|nr:hypothetical protein [Candidatus Sumerlaeota bacterium]
MPQVKKTMTWTSLGVERERSLLQKTSPLESGFIAIVLSLLGGLAGGICALLLYFQGWLQALVGFLQYGFRGGHKYDPVSGERLPSIFYNFTREEICGTAILGFIVGTIFTVYFMILIKRRQRELEQRYGKHDDVQ